MLSLGLSFSATAFQVYGEKQPHADIARGMDVLDAAFLIAQETPGGVQVLAQRMGVSPNTLQHKLNPNNTTHHLSLKEAVALQMVSGLPYVLFAMSAALDHVCLRSRPDVVEGDAWEAFRFLQQAMGELTAAAADANAAANPAITQQCIATGLSAEQAKGFLDAAPAAAIASSTAVAATNQFAAAMATLGNPNVSGVEAAAPQGAAEAQASGAGWDKAFGAATH